MRVKASLVFLGMALAALAIAGCGGDDDEQQHHHRGE